MSNLLKSASKIVLIIFAFALVAGLFTGHVDSQQFMNALMIVFTYYFTRRANKKGDESA